MMESSVKKTPSDKSLVGLAGEFHVLAQLAERGITGALTLGNTKRVDILVHNPQTGEVRKVEVKASRQKPRPAKLWHKGRVYEWQMSEKHEFITDKNLLYCFVQLAGPGILPRIFIVPARLVAKYVAWEHRTWWEAGKGKKNDSTRRHFRIEESDPDGYQNNWDLF